MFIMRVKASSVPLRKYIVVSLEVSYNQGTRDLVSNNYLVSRRSLNLQCSRPDEH